MKNNIKSKNLKFSSKTLSVFVGNLLYKYLYEDHWNYFLKLSDQFIKDPLKKNMFEECFLPGS